MHEILFEKQSDVPIQCFKRGVHWSSSYQAKSANRETCLGFFTVPRTCSSFIGYNYFILKALKNSDL